MGSRFWEQNLSLIFKIKDLFETQSFGVTTNYQLPDILHSGGGNFHYTDFKGKSFRNYSLTFEYKFGEFKAKRINRKSHEHNHEGGMGY